MQKTLVSQSEVRGKGEGKTVLLCKATVAFDTNLNDRFFALYSIRNWPQAWAVEFGPHLADFFQNYENIYLTFLMRVK